MSLRLQLTLAILSVVGVMGVVSLISFGIQGRLHERVAGLGLLSSVEVDMDVVLGRPVELEGRWEPEGYFLAKEVELLPWARRPKLRGDAQMVNPSADRLRVLGRDVWVTDSTEFSGGEGLLRGLEGVALGQRVEVSCSVTDSGRWVVRKLATGSRKASEKVKGTVTSAQREQGGGTRIEIEGLPAWIPAGVRMSFARGPLHRLGSATRMSVALQETLTSAQELLKERYKLHALGAGGTEGDRRRMQAVAESAQRRLERARDAFLRCLDQGHAVAEVQAGRRGDGAAWLGKLEEEREVLMARVEELAALAAEDPARAEDYLAQSFEPYLTQGLMPRVGEHTQAVEEALLEEFEGISVGTQGAARWIMITNLAGLLLALAVGGFVSHRIVRPLRDLELAARRVASGGLGARVEIRSSNEVGVLGRAFNHMIAELARSTLSVQQLENVIDSVDGALFVLDDECLLVSVNPAASLLLGRPRGELVGTPLGDLIVGDAEVGRELGQRVGPLERGLLHADGHTVPVSFTHAALGAGSGGAAGSVCVALDLSEHKRMEQALRRSLGEKELLVREVHHRVKSNLQVISSLLDLQARSIHDPTARERFQESQDRIQSMVFIHDQLHRTEDLGAIDLSAYLEVLVANLAELHRGTGRKIAVDVQVERVTLDLDRALSCGLIVNELVTNAFKHAFDGRSEGRVRIACESTANGDLRLEVHDDGRGGVPRAAGGSLGLLLVETLVQQLGGRLESSSDAGASFRVDFPLDAHGRAA